MRELLQKECWYIFNDKKVCFRKFIADGFMDCLQSKVDSLSARDAEYAVLLNDSALHNAVTRVRGCARGWVYRDNPAMQDSVQRTLALLDSCRLNESHWPMPFSSSIS